MARYATANDIINRAALEVGLVPQNDVYSTQDDSFAQLAGLMNSCGQELIELYPWEMLVKHFSVTTQAGDSGTYPLPDDFSYMIDQTGWDRTNRVAIGGPLSAQDWSYLKGRDLVSQSIYASFRLVEGRFDLFPQPPPEGLEVSFEYINRNWVQEQGTQEYKDSADSSSDVILFEPILIVKFLKVKFLDAKGFPSQAARQEFESIFDSRTGKDKGASILNAGRGMRGVPLLHSYYNLPDSGFGA